MLRIQDKLQWELTRRRGYFQLGGRLGAGGSISAGEAGALCTGRRRGSGQRKLQEQRGRENESIQDTWRSFIHTLNKFDIEHLESEGLVKGEWMQSS